MPYLKIFLVLFFTLINSKTSYAKSRALSSTLTPCSSGLVLAKDNSDKEEKVLNQKWVALLNRSNPGPKPWNIGMPLDKGNWYATRMGMWNTVEELQSNKRSLLKEFISKIYSRKHQENEDKLNRREQGASDNDPVVFHGGVQVKIYKHSLKVTLKSGREFRIDPKSETLLTKFWDLDQLFKVNYPYAHSLKQEIYSQLAKIAPEKNIYGPSVLRPNFYVLSNQEAIFVFTLDDLNGLLNLRVFTTRETSSYFEIIELN